MSAFHLLLRKGLVGIGAAAFLVVLLAGVARFVACGHPMRGECSVLPFPLIDAWFIENGWLLLAAYAAYWLVVMIAFRGELTTDLRPRRTPMSGPMFALHAFVVVALVLL